VPWSSPAAERRVSKGRLWHRDQSISLATGI
jgi:hypothetical protein